MFIGTDGLLSFRSGVFPSKTGRLAFPAVPSPRVAQFKPAPGIRWPGVGLLLSFVHLTVFPNVPHSVGSVRRRCTAMEAA